MHAAHLLWAPGHAAYAVAKGASLVKLLGAPQPSRRRASPAPQQSAAQCLAACIAASRGAAVRTPAPPAAGSSALPPLNIPKPKKTQAWALVESEFEEGLVGGKAGNLAKLRGKLPAGVASAALLWDSHAGQAAGQAAFQRGCC